MGLPAITETDLCRGIAQADLERVVHLFSERKFPKGHTIFERGDPGEALYIVKDGLVKLVSHSGQGTETILYLLPPGAIFGEILLSEERRAFTAIAVSDATVSALPKEGLMQLLSSVPSFSMNFIRLLSQRLAKVEKEHAGFGHTWSYHRLAKVLLDLGAEHGVKNPHGAAIPLDLTQEELANLIGTTRETVSTQMSRFRRLGLVRKEGKFLLLDVARLRRMTREAESP